MAKGDLFMVLESFNGTLDGAEVEYHKGEPIEADDPAQKKWPHLFGPLEFKHRRSVVEQATASPGEKRNLSLRRKAEPRKATAAEEEAIAETVEAEPTPAPHVGTPITTASFRPGR